MSHTTAAGVATVRFKFDYDANSPPDDDGLLVALPPPFLIHDMFTEGEPVLAGDSECERDCVFVGWKLGWRGTPLALLRPTSDWRCV